MCIHEPYDLSERRTKYEVPNWVGARMNFRASGKEPVTAIDATPCRAVVNTDEPPSTRKERAVYLIHGTSVAPAVTKTSTVPVCASQF